MRTGKKMGGLELINTMLSDGLMDAFNGYHMGITAENVARQWQITRDEQDQFAVTSQNNAEAAKNAGKFKDEIAPVTVKTRKGEAVVDEDEYIREGVELADVAKMRPAFDKEGTVTAGNASGINDGAAVDPAIMGSRPIPALRVALKQAGWTTDDLDLVEANEACAVNKDLGWDVARVNVNGGAIAIGHPMGASGARILDTLLYEMHKRDAKKGLATLCIGGGMGIAMRIQRY